MPPTVLGTRQEIVNAPYIWYADVTRLGCFLGLEGSVCRSGCAYLYDSVEASVDNVDDGGGGGCTMVPGMAGGGPVDPKLPALVGLAANVAHACAPCPGGYLGGATGDNVSEHSRI